MVMVMAAGRLALSAVQTAKVVVPGAHATPAWFVKAAVGSIIQQLARCAAVRTKLAVAAILAVLAAVVSTGCASVKPAVAAWLGKRIWECAPPARAQIVVVRAMNVAKVAVRRAWPAKAEVQGLAMTLARLVALQTKRVVQTVAAAKECASVLARELVKQVAGQKGKTAVGVVSSAIVRTDWLATMVAVR